MDPNRKSVIVITILLVLSVESSNAVANSTNLSEWWSIDKKYFMEGYNWDEAVLKLFDMDHLQIRHSNKTDYNSIHSCYDVRSTSHPSIYRRVCYPRIVITGQAKAGTSALFSFLQMHPKSVFSRSGGKDNCFPRAPFKSIFEYLNTFEKSVDENKIFVDGCMNPLQNMAVRKGIFKDPRTLYIYLTRDYADLLWSGYNYWCDPIVDKGCTSSSRWTKPSHIRNPANFDEMIRHTNKHTPVLPFLNNALEAAKEFYKKNIECLYQNAGEENVCMNNKISFFDLNLSIL
jgi:hypothetical protein